VPAGHAEQIEAPVGCGSANVGSRAILRGKQASAYHLIYVETVPINTRLCRPHSRAICLLQLAFAASGKLNFLFQHWFKNGGQDAGNGKWSSERESEVEGGLSPESLSGRLALFHVEHHHYHFTKYDFELLVYLPELKLLRRDRWRKAPASGKDSYYVEIYRTTDRVRIEGSRFKVDVCVEEGVDAHIIRKVKHA
jgi:hypothetical protein